MVLQLLVVNGALLTLYGQFAVAALHYKSFMTLAVLVLNLRTYIIVHCKKEI